MMLLQNQVTLRKRVNSMSTRTLVIKFYNSPVDTGRRFNVYKSIYDVKTTSCVYWTARLKAYKTQSIHTSQKDNYDVIVIVMTPYSFSRYLNCCLHFLAMYKKDLIRKIKVNFKIYDVINFMQCVYWRARLKAYKTQSIHASQKDNYDVIVIIMTPYSFSRYLNCCLHFLAMYKKDLIRKIKVNFKIYDVITWETNNCGTHIDQYLKKERRSDNENWSVNRILHEKHFS